jgi:hypothetical protein
VNNELQRLLVNSDSADWDFFGKTEVAGPPWVNIGVDEARYETLISIGVDDFRMTFYNVTIDGLSTVRTPIPQGTVVFDLPDMVQIDIVMFDPFKRYETQDSRERSRRIQSRVVYLDKLIDR